MKMWKQWMALLMIFCLLMPGALAGSIDLTDDLDEEVGSVTESSAGEDYTIMTFALGHGIVSQLYTVIVVITIHSIVTSHYGSDLTYTDFLHFFI